MAIPAPTYENPRGFRRAVHAHRRPLPLKTWDGTSSSLNSSHKIRCPPSTQPHQYYRLPISPESPIPPPSPGRIKQKHAYLAPIRPVRRSVKRKARDGRNKKHNILPPIHEVIPPELLLLHPPPPPPPNVLPPTPSTTPEPRESSNNHNFRHDQRPEMLDSITYVLNRHRREERMPLVAPPLAQFNEFGYIDQATYQWVPRPYFRQDSYAEPPPPPPPRDPPRKMPEEKERKAKGGHCNVKYSDEQKDFVRYHRADLAIKWDNITKVYENQFKDCPEHRETQGLQGICYRKNDDLPRIQVPKRSTTFHSKDDPKFRSIDTSQLPAIVNGRLLFEEQNQLQSVDIGQLPFVASGRFMFMENGQLKSIGDGNLEPIDNGQLEFMLNGHANWKSVKVRQQNECKEKYSLVFLYPERAMHYDWVQKAHRERAAALIQIRQLQFEKARLITQGLGTYQPKCESTVTCACCTDDERDAYIAAKENAGDKNKKGKKPPKAKKLPKYGELTTLLSELEGRVSLKGHMEVDQGNCFET
ncbi:hypothetical protein O1611_g5679 [Lasiodiplodia mahajangana]|uniref:Uncharacterized protein n=1 Tax=Lasiodiplodia mahajangana TaxID=1108764 RepID=A0ACC2JKA2_9PEZI|nr:hypothetical protein O1611_g5679 [Lasiodiplodia mahajangana]